MTQCSRKARFQFQNQRYHVPRTRNQYYKKIIIKKDSELFMKEIPVKCMKTITGRVFVVLF